MQKYKSRKYNKRKGKKTKKYLKKYQKGGAVRAAKFAGTLTRAAGKVLANAAIKTVGRTSGQRAMMEALEHKTAQIGEAVEQHVSPGMRKLASDLFTLVAEPAPQKFRGVNVKGSNAQTAAVDAVLKKLKAKPNLGEAQLGNLNVNPHAQKSRLAEEIAKHFNPFS